MLDLDGTITEIKGKPEEVIVSDDMRESLSRLAERFALTAIVSGRIVQNAKEIVGVDGITYVGNHGLEFILQDGSYEVNPKTVGFSKAIPRIKEGMEGVLSSLEDVKLEDKLLTLSFHYRSAPDPEHARKIILKALDEKFSHIGMSVKEGRKVVELRPDIGADKGTAVLKLIEGQEIRNVLYIGDDVTDIDAFNALKSKSEIDSFCIAVVNEEAKWVSEEADVTLGGVAEVKALLKYLAGPKTRHRQS